MENNNWYEKFREFLNDEENGFVIRLLMVFLGIILGAGFLTLGSFSDSLLSKVNLNILGWLLFLGFTISAIAWYYNEN